MGSLLLLPSSLSLFYIGSLVFFILSPYSCSFPFNYTTKDLFLFLSLSLSFYVCTYPEEPEDKQAMERNEKEGAIVMLGEGTEGLDWTLTGDVFHPDVISVREALPVERKISKGFRRDCAFTTQTHTAAGNIPWWDDQFRSLIFSVITLPSSHELSAAARVVLSVCRTSNGRCRWELNATKHINQRFLIIRTKNTKKN